MAKVEVLAEQSSDVSLQGNIIRCRVPSAILHSAGAEEPKTNGKGQKIGDAVDWQTLSNGEEVWIIGTVNKGGMVGRQATATVAAPAKKATKSAPAKKGGGNGVKAVKVASPSDLDSAFDDDWGDSVPVVKKPSSVPSVTKPQTKAVTVRPVAAKTRGGKYDTPVRKPQR
jgi:hypothetical protein